jgi:predicted transcriptional regulator
MNARTLVIDALVERIASWPAKAQEEAVASLLSIEARHAPMYVLSPDERQAVLAGLAEADRGEFVSDDDMAAFFKRHGL